MQVADNHDHKTESPFSPSGRDAARCLVHSSLDNGRASAAHRSTGSTDQQSHPVHVPVRHSERVPPRVAPLWTIVAPAPPASDPSMSNVPALTVVVPKLPECDTLRASLARE